MASIEADNLGLSRTPSGTMIDGQTDVGHLDDARVVGLPVVTLAVLVVISAGAAMANVLNPSIVLPLTLGVSFMISRALPQTVRVAGGSTPRLVWIALATLVLAVTAWNFGHGSELVITGRDGATYFNIAKSLSQGDSLRPMLVEPPFEDTEILEFASPGWEMREGGTAYPQFLHATPALWAMFATLGGDPALAGANAVLGGVGLWVMFGLLRRWVRPWYAFGAVATFAFTLPMVYYSRSTFAEPVSLALLWGGVWLACIAFDSATSGVIALLAGVTIGVTFVTRIDGWLYGLAIAVAAVLWKPRGDKLGDRTFDRLWLGFLAVALVGIFDLMVFSLPYLGSHRHLLLPLIVGSFGARIVAGTRLPTVVVGWTERLRERVAFDHLLSWAFAIAAAFMLVVRPLWLPAYGVSYGIAGLEAAAGLPVGSGRDYTEFAAHWPAWYLGWPAVLLSLYLAWRAVRAGLWNRSPVAVVISTMLLFGAGVYLVAPSANPDHVWVMRRFLPVLLPAIVASVWYGLDRAMREDRRWKQIAAGTVAISMIGWTAWTTAPFLGATDNAGSFDLIEEMCGDIDGRPVLLVTEEVVSTIALAEPIRQWCGVPVAAAAVEDTPGVLSALPGEVMVYSVSAEPLDDAGIQHHDLSFEIRYLESALFGSPRRLVSAQLNLVGGEWKR